MTYKEYQELCVEACVKVTGEDFRPFWNSCTFHDEYKDNLDPEEVAQNQLDSV
jgi:hypothetical protein